MFNQSLACCLPIFNQLQNFAHASSDFRDNVVASFVEFEREAISKNIDLKKIDPIKYALAALIDECVMNSTWSGKLVWMRRSLQLQFFGEHIAGEGFFERLSQLRQSGSTEIDVLEIYALCLQFGFQGMYRFKDKTQLSALRAGLESQIEVIRGKRTLSLSLPTSPDELLAKKTRDIPLWWVGIVTIALIFFICLGYSAATHIQLHHAIKTLSPEFSYER
ncbi:MAG TPA: type IVB secretion system protein IcmH/DotU [Gammaproteobacteria bacterium]|nr:type IVB secretion system protein IcmH/DotU [Gammaproteobacteria bacterium]